MNGKPLLKDKDKKEKSHSSSWWQKKCDSLMQAIERTRWNRCEVCGKANEVGHHFITKSQSSFLRYEWKNIVPLCHSCHFKHHIQSDPHISATIIQKRGKEWYEWIEAHRRLGVKTGVNYYKQVWEHLTKNQ